MSFDLPTVILPSVASTKVNKGFLDIVAWHEDPILARRALSGAQYRAATEFFDLHPYGGDGDGFSKEVASSHAYRTAVTVSPYLRRRFSAGEANYDEARQRTKDSFEASLETYLTRYVLAEASVGNLTPGTTPSFLGAVALLERAISMLHGGHTPGYILVPPFASVAVQQLFLSEDFCLPSGTCFITSPGATPGGEIESLDAMPEEITLYAFGQPFGLHTDPMVTSSVAREDFDFSLNDQYVTVENTISIGFDGIFDGTQIFACNATTTLEF